MEADTTTGYIVVYGPTLQKTNLRVNPFKKFLRLTSRGAFFDFDVSRITFINVKSENEKTEFLVIPKGAEPPVFKNQEK